jgi:hypothetical protein
MMSLNIEVHMPVCNGSLMTTIKVALKSNIFYRANITQSFCFLLKVVLVSLYDHHASVMEGTVKRMNMQICSSL